MWHIMLKGPGITNKHHVMLSLWLCVKNKDNSEVGLLQTDWFPVFATASFLSFKLLYFWWTARPVSSNIHPVSSSQTSCGGSEQTPNPKSNPNSSTEIKSSRLITNNCSHGSLEWLSQTVYLIQDMPFGIHRWYHWHSVFKWGKRKGLQYISAVVWLQSSTRVWHNTLN